MDIEKQSFFYKVSPAQLNAHLLHLAKVTKNGFEGYLWLGESAIKLSIAKICYKKKSDKLVLWLKSSEVGRQDMDKIMPRLLQKNYDMQLRRSAKLRLISQCKLLWSVEDRLLPAYFKEALKVICDATEQDWPAEMIITYPTKLYNSTLPGEEHSNPHWKRGRKIGSKIVQLIRFFS